MLKYTLFMHIISSFKVNNFWYSLTLTMIVLFKKGLPGGFCISVPFSLVSVVKFVLAEVPMACSLKYFRYHWY